MVDRVLVLGCCGAGKSTFSRRLGQILNLPPIHLDAEYWGEGWAKPERGEWRRRLAELTAEPRWLLDGNYFSSLDLRLPRAELVVFLDPPRGRCLRGIVKRRLLRNRVDPIRGCRERISRDLLTYVWRFPRRHRPKLLEMLGSHAGHAEVVRLRRARDIRDWPARFEARAAAN